MFISITVYSVVMDEWKITSQSHDVIKYKSRNTYIDVSLTTKKKQSKAGETDFKVEYLTRLFKIINNQKVYSAEEAYSTSISNIKDGKIVMKYPC